MNIRDVLYMRNTGKLRPRALIQDKLLAQKLSGGGVITTATGNPVSIVTNKAQNAISTILSYSPKQSGSGDPSPQNIRPIEGWTDANLGVNSEAPTTTISLGGTYYGFSVDVERGVLRVNKVIAVFDGSPDEAWIAGSFSNYYIAVSGITANDSTKIMVNANILKPIAYNNRSAETNPCIFENPQSNIELRNMSSLGVTSTAGLKAFLNDNNLTVAYELAEPIELPLTPQTVALLAGNNTIWTDGDEVSVTYKAKK